MFDRLWDFFVESLMSLFLPMVCTYFALSGNLFFNVAARESSGLEKVGDTLLTPCRYMLAGKVAVPDGQGSWVFTQQFDYRNAFWPKTIASAVAFLPCVSVGSICKALSFLTGETKARYRSMLAALQSRDVHSNADFYEEIGIRLGRNLEKETLVSQGHKRRPGDEMHMAGAKKGLAEIGALLTAADIPWWIDCGSCLGAYRYGGSIPWDDDIDLSVLVPDFNNVIRALNGLDPKRYHVQDWSSRSFPQTYMKVYMLEYGTLIDIFCYTIDPQEKTVRTVFSLEETIFFPEWFKIRERAYTVPVAIDDLFPLKRALFDGVEVFMPNDTPKFLQRYFGENLNPAKIYDPKTGRFEKDLSHPYWQKAYVH
jgi:hypothetical protein